ncbi:D-alanyl-D-alanine carboxypeptidase DacB [Acaryochloris thomasi RCC1774]|uniref:D-alanyl-D-alanine carboxypeptidase DacB n=1 Tax=Acaryochloris thomasi RCC1774 TaxID=1764569 RepID=A0A2W1JP67_9CYAN|nr:D-alanyl-D-alanine carboxypeptidase [Acaryochloris thomasi]PZD70687.1 D-alanyl-D-alanine carboxypeptidase DacB [Acaryochloris thomasi RCC1774]
MLQLLSLGLLPLWLETANILQPPEIAIQQPLDLLMINHPDRGVETVIDDYLANLEQQGFSSQNQGIWLQTSDQLLAYHGADQPLSGASLTKVATTLAALKTWTLDHQFVTDVSVTGPIQQGVLQGDLIIHGGNDPLFVGGEAIGLGAVLNQLGIQQIAGNLVISGPFVMEFQSNPQQSGQLLLNGFNGQVLPGDPKYPKYNLSTAAVPLPKISLKGRIVAGSSQRKGQVIVQHRSLPMLEILKQLNVHSNNHVADQLAQLMGGSSVVVQKVAAEGIPAQEVLLINGSGLGQDNRVSPRAVAGLFQAIERHLQPQNLTVADLFPVAGRDFGTIKERNLPAAAVVKTGTLWNVSALAGVLPTRKYGPVWFTVINGGPSNTEGFRQAQDRFLQTLSQRWGRTDRSVWTAPTRTHQFGEPERNQVLKP